MWDPVTEVLFVSSRNVVAKIDLRNVKMRWLSNVQKAIMETIRVHQPFGYTIVLNENNGIQIW